MLRGCRREQARYATFVLREVMKEEGEVATVGAGDQE
jgi:hypothetical protein